MRLAAVNIHNFRVIKQAQISFPDNVIGIIGPNGAGKSSIVEAIAWALYGNPAARSGKDEIRSTFAKPTEDCRVELIFQVNGETYKMARRLVGRKGRPEVELYRGTSSESVGSTETQRHIAQLLGLDWRGFLTSFLARQQELNALSDLQPAKRREHLAGMLGIERLDKALQRVKEDTRLNQDKALFIRSQLLEKEQVNTRISQLREQIETLGKHRDLQSGAHNETRAIFQKTSDRYKKVQEARDACSRVLALADAEARTASLLSDQLTGLTREHETLLGFNRELSQLDVELSDYDSVKAGVESGKEIRGKVEYIRQLVGQRDELQVELERITEKAREVKVQLSKVATKLSGIPDDVETLHDQAQAELGLTRDTYSRIRARKEVLADEIGKVKSQIAGVKEIGPDMVCDRCHRPYGSDLPDIQQHLELELSELVVEDSKLAEQLHAIKKEGEAAKAGSEELVKQVSLKYELSVKRDSLDQSQSELTRRKENLTEQASRLKHRISNTGPAEFDEARFQQASARLAQLEVMRSRHSQLSGSLKRLPDVEKGITDTNNKLSAANAERERLQANLQRIDFDQTRFDKTSSEFTEIQERMETEKTALLELSKELELMQTELHLKQEQMTGFERAEEELERCVSRQYQGEKLRSLFADFRKHVIARIRPRLAELSTSLFSEMTGDRFNLVELDEDYNLQIMDYGHLFGIERFSGGEKDLANLCLRLAISQALTESAGLERSFVILDEVFGSQDSDRRSLIFNGLASLKNRFPQILLITHIEEIKDRVETLIQVEPTSGGWSEVRVNGRPA
jgi:exonuclease SbcC